MSIVNVTRSSFTVDLCTGKKPRDIDFLVCYDFSRCLSEAQIFLVHC